MEREGVSTLSILRFLWALRCLAHLKYLVIFVCFEKYFGKCLSAEIRFMITLESVLKSVDKVFL